MTRRTWLLFFGSGLCTSSLLPACHRQEVQGPALAGPPLVCPAPAPVPDPIAPPATPVRSPYNETAAPLVGPPAPPEHAGTTDLKQTLYQPPQTLPPADPPSSPPLAATAPPPAVMPRPPAAPEVPLVAALRCFLDKRPDDALVLLQHYDKPNQDLLLCLLPLVARLTEGSLERANSRDVSVEVEQLEKLLAPLRPRKPAPSEPPLAIEQMCFCNRIEKFGVYEPLPRDHPGFRPGEMVQLYVELRNFASEYRDHVYLTHLSSSIEIQDYNKQRKWGYDFPEDRNPPDVSRTLRHDYFNNYRFSIPPHLAPGKYTLWLRVTDKGRQPARTAECSLDFQVISMPFKGMDR